MSISLLTNLIALVVLLAGLFLPEPYGEALYLIGTMALSGSITNWLAIYMLFDKIPFCYGSGIIPQRFEEFKAGIRALIIEEFFTPEHIERFFREQSEDLDRLVQKIPFDSLFDSLAEAVVDSKLGSVLRVFGGASALEPLRGRVIGKLQASVHGMAAEALAREGAGGDFIGALIHEVEALIDTRLNELTPEMVKNIVQDMIREHLGWLVVWGGVFGALIGLVTYLVGSWK